MVDLDQNLAKMMSMLRKFITKSLRWIQLVLLLLFRACLRNPKTTIAAFLVLYLSSFAGLKNTRFLIAIDDIIDSKFETYADLNRLKDSFNDQNHLFVKLKKSNGAEFSKEELCSIKHWIQNQVDNRADTHRFFSTLGLKKVVNTEKNFSFPNVFDIDCGALSVDESQKIHEAFNWVKNSPWHNALSSLDGKQVFIHFFLANTATNLFYGHFDTGIVPGIENDLQTNFLTSHPGIEADWSGVSAFQYHLREGFNNTAILNLAMFFLILVVFRIFFLSWTSGILFSATIGICSTIIYGYMGYFHAPIDVISNSLSLMLFIASLEDFIFVTYIQGKYKNRSYLFGFRKMLIPSFFTSLTTAIGFGSLYVSNLSTISRFGIWAGIAALLEWAMVFLLLPSVLKIYPKLRIWTTFKKNILYSAVAKLANFNLYKPIAYFLLIFYFVAFYGATKLKVTDTPEAIFSKDHVVQKTMHKMTDETGWQILVSLIFNTNDRDTQRSIIEKTKKHPTIYSVESVTDSMEFIGRDLPEGRKDLIEMFWKNSESSRRLISEDGTERALLFLKETDMIAMNQFRDWVKTDLCPNDECEVAGTLVSYSEFGDKVLKTLLESFAVSLLIVALILVYLCIGLGLGNITKIVLSALWGPSMMVSLFYIFDIPVFYVTSIFASILVGLAGDNTIQFLFSSKNKGLHHGIDDLSNAATIVTISMIIMPCVLFLSVFAPLKTIGWLMTVGFSLGYIGDLYLYKAFIAKKK